MSVITSLLRESRIACLASAVLIAGLSSTIAYAQATQPAFRFGEAALIDPADSSTLDAYYGTSTTHTDGVADGRSDEIKALAKGLDHDPDLLFEYVRDHIEYYATFGSGKGALGTHLDKSGSAFDQAVLLAELLDEAGSNGASVSNIDLKYGTLSLSEMSEIAGWLGHENADDVCRLLANGGIPAKVNGGTDCSVLSGSVSSLDIAHVWVTATVDGTAVTYDPAYKTYATIAPIESANQDFREAMGATCTNASAIGTSSPNSPQTTAGSTYITGFSNAGLKSHLDNCASTLWAWLESHAATASIEEIIGGRTITPRIAGVYVAPNGTYSASKTWTEVPDSYRLKFTVTLSPTSLPQDEITFDLFADEISGKRVSLEANGFDTITSSNAYPSEDNDLPAKGNCGSRVGSDWYYHTVRLTIQGEAVPGVGYKRVCPPNFRGAQATLSVDAPYAADSGSYMDAIYTQPMTVMTRAVLALTSGETSSDATRYYSEDLGLDRGAAELYHNEGYFPQTNGDGYEIPSILTTGARVAENLRFNLFRAWAEQFSRMNQLAGDSSEASVLHHYTIGWVYGQSKVGVNGDCDNAGVCVNEWTMRDDTAVLSLETGVSITKTGADAIPLRRTLAAASAALEASIMEQQLDTTAPSGTAQKFRWANESVVARTPSQAMHEAVNKSNSSPQESIYPIYKFDNGADLSILTSDGYDDCQASAPFSNFCMESFFAGTIQSYLDAGYEVVAIGDAYAGPGLRCGSATSIPGGSIIHPGPVDDCFPNPARGGAFIAYRPDFSDIAHINLSGGRISKGGGAGPSAPDELAVIDIPTPADLLKEEEEDGFAHTVDLRSGKLNLSSGALLSSGSAAFPYALSFSRSFSGGEKGLTDPVWNHNWHMPLTISGSGNEMMGASRGIFATQTLTMLLALEGVYGDSGTSAADRIKQETVGSLIAAWWTDTLTHNVASASFNGSATQFVRKLNTDTFLPATGGAARLVQSGSRYKGLPYSVEATPQEFNLTTEAWRTDNLSFTLTNPGQDEITYEFYRNFEYDPWEGYDHTNQGPSPDKTGFRATQWTFPSGMQIDFTYQDNASHCGAPQNCPDYRLLKVENNLGRELTFTGPADNPTTVTDDASRSITLTDSQVTHPDGKVTSYDISLDYVYLTSAHQSATLNSVTDSGFAGPNHLFTYDLMDEIETYENALGQQWTYRIGGGRRGATINPLGDAAIEYFDEDGNTTRMIDRVGNETLATYDGLNRLKTRTYPEGNSLVVFYDAQSNITRVDQVSKDASTTLTTTANYHTLWQTPIQVTDARGNVTDITYVETGPGAGQVQFVDQPTDPSGNRPRFAYVYDTIGRLTSATSPEGEVQTSSYGAKGVFNGITIDPAGFNLTTSITAHTAWGLPLTVDGPRGDVSDIMTMTYDLAGRPETTTDPLGQVTETIYDAYGWAIKTCAQSESAGTAPACDTATHANQSYWAVTQTTHDLLGRESVTTDPSGFESKTVYDDAGRAILSVDAEGRKVRTVYDAAGRVTKLIKAWQGNEDGTGGTEACTVPGTLQQCYQQYTYTPNGQIETVTDANGNVTTYYYDGHDRLAATHFPSKDTPGQSAIDVDYEFYTYDANGNMLTKRTRSGDIITYQYDALNRSVSRLVPGAPTHSFGGVTVSHSYTYDLAGRQLSATHDGVTLGWSYDSAGRMVSATRNGADPVSYGYDAAGNVTSLTYPDGYEVAFEYDALSRVDRALEVKVGPDRELASLAYDPLSRRTAVTYANGTGASFAYTQRGELTDHTITLPYLPGNPVDIDYDFTYNGVGQLTSETVSEAAMMWLPEWSSSKAYNSNGLNQYTSLSEGAAPELPMAYDGRGNLTDDGKGRVFTYDAENVLRQVDEGGTQLATYRYGADNTRLEKSVSGQPMAEYWYTGDQEIMETDSAGATVRRYLRLPGSVDEAFLMIDYFAGGVAMETWAHTNRLGSTVATSDAVGVVLDTYTYDDYGNSGAEGTSGFPFRFTGQKLDPETGLMYYKARYYSADLGRFLQVDPIGYEDQMNMYAYVHNDPLNGRDPTGMFQEPAPQPEPTPEERPRPANDNRPHANDNNPRNNNGSRVGILGRIAGALGLATALEGSNNDQNTLFRGLSNTDVTNLETTGAIQPSNPNGTVTPEQHALGAEGSQYISLTTSRSVAEKYASGGPNPSGYVVELDAQGMVAAGKLTFHSGFPSYSRKAQTFVLKDQEVLANGPIPVVAIRRMYRVPIRQPANDQ